MNKDQYYTSFEELSSPVSNVQPKGNLLTFNATNSSKININANILDEFGTPFYDANIAVNNQPIARADSDGNFSIKNINASDLITISYVGYTSINFTASSLPKQIKFSKPVSQQLQAVIITTKPKEKNNEVLAVNNTNWYLWGALGIVGLLVVKKFSGTSKKYIQAKI